LDWEGKPMDNVHWMLYKSTREVYLSSACAIEAFGVLELEDFIKEKTFSLPYDKSDGK
jgi:hypothetical protein